MMKAILFLSLLALLINGAPVETKLAGNDTQTGTQTGTKKENQTETVGSKKEEGVKAITPSKATNQASSYRQTASNQLNVLGQNATKEQKIIIADFLAKTIATLLVEPKKSEEKTVRLYADLNKAHHDVFQIMKTGFTIVERDFKGGEEARKFLAYYYEQIAQMKSGSDEDLNLFLKQVRSRWNKLSQEAKDDMNREFEPTVDLIEGLEILPHRPNRLRKRHRFINEDD